MPLQLHGTRLLTIAVCPRFDPLSKIVEPEGDVVPEKALLHAVQR